MEYNRNNVLLFLSYCLLCNYISFFNLLEFLKIIILSLVRLIFVDSEVYVRC